MVPLGLRFLGNQHSLGGGEDFLCDVCHHLRVLAVRLVHLGVNQRTHNCVDPTLQLSYKLIAGHTTHTHNTCTTHTYSKYNIQAERTVLHRHVVYSCILYDFTYNPTTTNSSAHTLDSMCTTYQLVMNYISAVLMNLSLDSLCCTNPCCLGTRRHMHPRKRITKRRETNLQNDDELRCISAIFIDVQTPFSLYF